LADAKADKPVVFRLLIDTPEVIEYWERGRIRIVPQAEAPSADIVLERLLHTHRRRFKPARDRFPATVPGKTPIQLLLAPLDTTGSPHTTMWLERGGRFVNRHADTNTLAVADDAQAVALFLRDRASRSRHTFRAYAAELRRLIRWCENRQCGPLSDLNRNDLLGYRDALRGARAETSDTCDQRAAIPSEKTSARALAVVASLYQYWFDTGYLSANPAAGLVTGAQARVMFAPQRFIPTEVLAACDAWVYQESAVGKSDITVARRRAIWALYRYSGVRLAELAWTIDIGLPRVEADHPDQWTLFVSGKGQKLRAIPLPIICIAVLRTYRVARGLSSEPKGHEQLPLIHGFKGGSLQEAGLYSEVKSIFDAVADRIEPSDPENAILLRRSSPHWLRHVYAKTLVVDHKVPLPVAQSLLGHASVQTTAAYAKTDLSQLREFVELSFAKE
jgi:site-specific recombinase XerD